MARTALVWGDALAAYDFGRGHPLDPRRLRLALELIERLGLAGRADVLRVAPRMASDAELESVHDGGYIAAVRRASALAPDDPAARDPVLRRYGLGSDDVPVAPGMHDAAARIAGATLVAAEQVMGGMATRAFSIAGGLHHAHRAEAAGFCIYNDLAIAIRWLRQAHGARVLYLDIDAHHGDGVQWLFYEDPDVLTVSLHESGMFLYPGTGGVDEVGRGDGYGTAVNVPLEPHTADASWRAAFDAVVPAAVEAFAPDVIVLQAGCDAHALDPLTHLRCTTGLFEWAVRRTVALADAYCAGRLIATGGGGYAIEAVVPRAWALVFAALCGTTPDDALPDDWLAARRAADGVEPPRTLRDAPDAFAAPAAEAAAARTNTRTVGMVRQQVLPLVTGWGMAF